MILNPRQLHLMRMGCPTTPANRSDSSTSSATTDYNYADKRNAVQGGVGISGDGNMVFNSSTTTDLGAIQAALQGMSAANGVNGAVAVNAMGINGAVASNALNVNGAVAVNAIQDMSQASQHLSDVSLSMLQGSNALTNSLASGALAAGQQMVGLNTSLAASLANGSNNLVTHLMDTAGGLYRDAASHDAQVVGIAQDLAKTQVAAANDNRYLIAAGMAVVCIVAVMAFRKGA